jgi:hypothetical protein
MMERWLLNVETACADPTKEKAFNEWYNTVHLHDMMEVPGIVRVSRYEFANPTEGQPKFMAMYEIETNDFGQTMAAMGEQLQRITEKGRMSELCIVAGARMYKQITPPMEKKKTK